MRTLSILLTLLLAFLPACSRQTKNEKPADVDYYTCSMHPSVRSQKPGDRCPICSMELVPVFLKSAALETPEGSRGMGKTANGGSPPIHPHNHSPTSSFTVPVERQQQIGVTYAPVEMRPMRYTIRSVGLVEPETGKLFEYVSRVEGYVQELQVTSPGQRVQQGQALLSIYSPDLLTTEQEFVDLLRSRDIATEAMRRSTDRLLESARRRLRLWNISDEEIAALEKSRRPAESLVLRSPFDGVVQAITTRQGMNVKVGDRLVSIVDLSRVWVWAEFYENELPLLQPGQKLEVTIPSAGDQRLDGELAVIDPFLDPMKRTARVRIDVPNPERILRPGMYANVDLQVNAGETLTVPVSAVLPTGKRMLAFVDRGEGKLEPRYIKAGRKFGESAGGSTKDYYEVIDGLVAGERVVASANFLIDAEAKIQGAVKSFEGETETRGHGDAGSRRADSAPLVEERQ